ncbi:MAG: hypothetical protein JO131_04950, partial [Gammaproteobacteria bacterium]|nr:hypothetical protein [Gammaproteobacteria bacterium]
HNINFNSDLSQQPQPMYRTTTMYTGASIASMGHVNNLVVGNKLRITANVILAAAPNADVMKLTGQK